MFGYVLPYKPELLVCEYEMYKGVYCSLCKSLSKKYGVFAKMILSYDCTFFAIMLAGIRNSLPCMEKKRCTVNPLKKCSYCTSLSDVLDVAAAFSVISFFYKLKDDIEDEGILRRSICRFLLLFAKRYRKKAIRKYDYLNIDEIVKNTFMKQNEIEKKSDPFIDECAEPSALMLRGLMESVAKDESEKQVFGDFGYYLGRWVYLIDACDDCIKDIDKKSFNPIIKSFNIKNKDGYNEEVRLKCNQMLNMTVASLVLAYRKIKLTTYKGISDNIIEKGLANMQKKLLFDQFDEKIDKKALKKGI